MTRYVNIECDAVTEILPRRAFKTRQDIQDFLDNIPTADVKEKFTRFMDRSASSCLFSLPENF